MCEISDLVLESELPMPDIVATLEMVKLTIFSLERDQFVKVQKGAESWAKKNNGQMRLISLGSTWTGMGITFS